MWIIGGESCNYHKHRICFQKGKISSDPLHLELECLIEFYFLQKKKWKGRQGSSRTNRKLREKEKRRDFPLWENPPWNIPSWPRSDKFLHLWERWEAFNQRSLLFQESGAPAALCSLSRCWELHDLYFILLIKGMLQEGKINFTQMFHLNTTDEPKHSGVLFGVTLLTEVSVGS